MKTIKNNKETVERCEICGTIMSMLHGKDYGNCISINLSDKNMKYRMSSNK